MASKIGLRNPNRQIREKRLHFNEFQAAGEAALRQ